jgi:hypothetical protein
MPILFTIMSTLKDALHNCTMYFPNPIIQFFIFVSLTSVGIMFGFIFFSFGYLSILSSSDFFLTPFILTF